MSDQAWDLDFSGTTVKDADLSSGKPPPGWYRGVLESVEDNNEDGAKILTFKFTHGPLAGVKHKERLNNPRFANSSGAIEFAKRKANCYAGRMGLVSDAANGKTVQVPFSTAVGKEFVFKLTQGKGEYDKYLNIDFDLYTAGHPKLGADVYPLVGLVAPATAPKGGGDAHGKNGSGGETVPATRDTEAINKAAAAVVMDWK